MTKPDADGGEDAQELAAMGARGTSWRMLLLTALTGAFIVVLFMAAAHFAEKRDAEREAAERAAPAE